MVPRFGKATSVPFKGLITMKMPYSKVFEPITEPMIKLLHFEGRRHGLSRNDLHRLVADLIDIPIITALSMHEAQFLIGTITKQTSEHAPLPPPYANQVEGYSASLPGFYHVQAIRRMLKHLGWSREKIQNWMVKYRKVDCFRSMSRRKAQKTFYILKNIVDMERRHRTLHIDD